MRTAALQDTCERAGRVDAVAVQEKLNGIEYLEVAPDDQTTLHVFFVRPLPGVGTSGEAPPGGARLTPANVRIEGGVRVRNIRVLDAVTMGNELTVTTSAAGDFSTYRLRLVTNDNSDDVPIGYDPHLASIDFSFKAGCPSEFDCERDERCQPEQLAEPLISYRAKDYASFRRLMLDRMNVLMPAWRDGSPADPLITVVEALALTADHLSYWQDAIATEAYLGTARRRVSLRRHARMLDYPMHNGCNARTWVHFGLALGTGTRVVKAGTPVLTRESDDVTVMDESQFANALRTRPTVFATRHDVSLRPEHNAIALYACGNMACCLPKGATRATLVNDPPLLLQAGDWLLFEEVFDPKTGVAADADPDHRQVVRLRGAGATKDPLNDRAILEIEWDPADALRFSLCLDQVPGAPAGTAVSVARGNLVLADHGIAIRDEDVQLEPAPSDRPPRARLQQPGLTFAVPFDAELFAREAVAVSQPIGERAIATFLTAAAAQDTSPAAAMPVVEIRSGPDLWQPRADLLASDRFTTDVVVEMEDDGTASLRFGDDVHGRRPPNETVFAATYRIGNGRVGNVGADALTRVMAAIPEIELVRNPLPAVGGVDPETMESVRQFAPQAFRRQERAVTAEDWADVAQRDGTVQRAAAQFRWTGSWHTVFVAVDRKGGLAVGEEDPRFLSAFRAHLDRYRLAGYDVEIAGPLFVPLDLKLEVCVKPGYFRSDVKKELLDRFGVIEHTDGSPGFFHPDNFTFGQDVYLSRVYEEAMKAPGVDSVRVVRFQRYGKLAAGELADGVVAMSSFEVARCDNDPSRPEFGRVEVEVEGGL